MKYLSLAIFSCLLFASPALAAPPQVQGPLLPNGYCQLSVAATAVQTSTCPGGIPARSTYVLICNEGAAARWRDDGIAPTASIGSPVASGAASSPVCFNYYGTLATLQWIAQTGTSLINLVFYK